MKTKLTGGRVFLADRTFKENCPILIENDRILEVGKGAVDAFADTVIDLDGAAVLPGLVDVHTHGRIGYDFCDATKEEMGKMQSDYAKHGVTSVFATLASATQSEWIRAIKTIEQVGFEGIHLEGRYLNFAKRGVHAPDLLVPLNANELSEVLSHIHIPCHITAALELDSDGSFSEMAIQRGATLGLGHTAANADEARLAVSRGATSFTHLYNAMPPLHHREGGAVSVALGGSGFAELIVDGVHICPDMINMSYRCLGCERTVLITDSMSGTGCPDGDYMLAGMAVTVKDGRALTADGVIAGSTLNLWDGVKNLMKFANVPLADAVACATVNPARMVGIENEVGSIEKGKRADLVVLSKSGDIDRVWRLGQPIC